MTETDTRDDVQVFQPRAEKWNINDTKEISHPSKITEQDTQNRQSLYQRVYDIIAWTPPRCRWDPDKPPKFSMPLNVLFGFAGAFTVGHCIERSGVVAHDLSGRESILQPPDSQHSG